MLPLVTKRLKLSKLSRRHVDPMLELWADPEVTKFMGGPRDPEVIRPFVEEDIGSDEDFLLWPVEDLQTNAFVGNCGILEKEIAGQNEHELIYLIVHAYWGLGLATEIGTALIDHAKSTLKLTRLVALIDPENAMSVKVAQKLGFKLERKVERGEGIVKDLYSKTL